MSAAVRPRVDQFAQLIAVARTRVEKREDQQFGRSTLQLAIERARVDICHEQILCRQVFSVNFCHSISPGRSLTRRAGHAWHDRSDRHRDKPQTPLTLQVAFH